MSASELAIAEAVHEEDPSERAAPWWRRWSLPGCWGALVLGALSFTPSLLPRSGAVQGVIGGVSAAIGYGIAVLGAWAWREVADRDARRPSPRSWRILLVTGLVVAVAAIALGQLWQGRIRELMEMPGEGFGSRLVLPIAAVLVFLLLVAVGRGVRWLARRLVALLGRWIGDRAARAIGWAVVLVACLLTLTGVVVDGLLSAADRAFAVRDLVTPDGIERPTSELRSGSEASLVDWDSLGREGRVFTGSGPDADAIEAFTGSTAQEPIRIYTGMASADDTEEQARLAVEDLQRAGGFDRAYLLIVNTTGSGWVVPDAAESFEYMVGGDSAIVAMQYSHLPSWISYLVDQERAREAGREMFDAVYEQWMARAPDDRPELLVFGESLGSFGGETAFSGEHDLVNRTSGALFVGPPNFNTLYREFADDRDAGSREVDPVYRNGRAVRFTNDVTADVPPAETPWTRTRVLYLVHPSDPIVWWSPDLLLRRPDWLEEPRGRDVSDRMVWLPFVTFWQVTGDLLNGVGVPPGHGHNYRGDHVDGWVEVLQPPGWTDERTAELREVLT